jgi:hypothetical protein
VFAAFLGCALCVATISISPECRGGEAAVAPAAGVSASSRPGAVTNELQAAALRGLNWLVEKKDAMPLGFALKNFEKIHRATADEGIRQQMARLTREKVKALPDEAPKIDPADPDLHTWYGLRPAVMDLIYLKSLGKPWKTEADKIVQLYAKHGEAILPLRSTLSERLVAAYKLKILGVPTDEIYANTLAEIRAQEPAIQQLGGGRDMMNLYARTHVIFTASAYYSRHLDPAGFAPEIASFTAALEQFSRWEKMNDSWTDLASEIVIARKILRLPPDANTEALCRRLVALQNSDGSWGSGPFSNGKVHHTAMSVLALLEFADEFKVGLDYL